jgi:hypothetical protein
MTTAPCIISTVGDVSEFKYDILEIEITANSGTILPSNQPLERWAYELSLQYLLYFIRTLKKEHMVVSTTL